MSNDEIIRVEEVYKIFGPQPRGRAFDLVQQGAKKDEVHARSGHVVGLNDVNFDVRRGEIFVVMGLSGCAGTLTHGAEGDGGRLDDAQVEPDVYIGDDGVIRDAQVDNHLRIREIDPPDVNARALAAFLNIEYSQPHRALGLVDYR